MSDYREKAREWLELHYHRVRNGDAFDSLAALLEATEAEAYHRGAEVGRETLADVIREHTESEEAHQRVAAENLADFATLREQVATAEAERNEIVGLVQRFQPGGSPPPIGHGPTLVRWILDSLRVPLEKAEADRDALAAKCAVYREALEELIDHHCSGVCAEDQEARGYVPHSKVMAQCDAALATPDAAAEAMVERVRAEEWERCVTAARTAVEAARPHTLASENADLYIAYEDGAKSVLAALSPAPCTGCYSQPCICDQLSPGTAEVKP